ncbi:MAG: hypothetical protein KDD69_16110 [Bdellovibrionales bacterium]|nr:hypothetical protein [Bdellovibrionales bacterium]
MSAVRVGIQGIIGSTNYRAAQLFAERHGWKDLDVIPLINSRQLLSAVAERLVDYGTVAWESRAGIVLESELAMRDFTFERVDELVLQINHAILIPRHGKLDRSETVLVRSHPQALIEHESVLRKTFPQLELVPEEDTALAAKLLSSGAYPSNCVVVAPIECATIYGLEVLLRSLPSNAGYWVRIFLLKAAG